MATSPKRGSNVEPISPKRGMGLLVLKVGSSTLLMNDERGQRVRLKNVAALVEQIAELKLGGYQVVLVSSGAVGMGLIKLGIPKPTSLRTKQAVAAAGQSQLMRMYEDMFVTVGLHCAQLLISQSDFMDKVHWQNIKHTIHESLKLDLVPVINENDVTNTEELRFGDNDNLAALTAVQLEADWLFLCTDVDYLYTANPRVDPSAEPLRVVPEPWALKVDTKSGGSSLGTGGMATKLMAGRTASAAGIRCGLINGAHVDRMQTFLKYDADSPESPLPEGTYFMAMNRNLNANRAWILSLPASGELVIDDGAARALAENKSLLPVGILKVTGQFLSGEAVKICHRSNEVARATVNFTSDELTKIKQRNSSEFEEILGYTCCAEACYRGATILMADPEFLRKQDVLGKLKEPPTPSRHRGSDNAKSSSQRSSRSAER